MTLKYSNGGVVQTVADGDSSGNAINANNVETNANSSNGNCTSVINLPLLFKSKPKSAGCLYVPVLFKPIV